MAGTDDIDDNRLAGRTPRSPRHDVVDEAPAVDDDADGPDDHEIDAVNRLMGFLRGSEDQ